MYLNELMNARQMSRTELSARSRVPESTLRDILSGKTQLDRCEAATLYDLAAALQVSIEDILENNRCLPHCDLQWDVDQNLLGAHCTDHH